MTMSATAEKTTVDPRLAEIRGAQQKLMAPLTKAVGVAGDPHHRRLPAPRATWLAWPGLI